MLGLAVTLGGLWIVNYALLMTDYGDARGFSECWPDCSALQDLVATIFWSAGALALLLTIVFSLGALAMVSFRRTDGS